MAVTYSQNLNVANVTLETIFLKGEGFPVSSLFPRHDTNLPRSGI